MFSLNLLRRKLQAQLQNKFKNQRTFFPSVKPHRSTAHPRSVHIPFEICNYILPVSFRIWSWGEYPYKKGRNMAYLYDGEREFKTLVFDPMGVRPSFLTQQDMMQIEKFVVEHSPFNADGSYVRYVRFSSGKNQVINFEIEPMNRFIQPNPKKRIVWIPNDAIPTNFDQNDLDLFKQELLRLCVNEPEGKFLAMVTLFNALSDSAFRIDDIQTKEQLLSESMDKAFIATIKLYNAMGDDTEKTVLQNTNKELMFDFQSNKRMRQLPPPLSDRLCIKKLL